MLYHHGHQVNRDNRGSDNGVFVLAVEAIKKFAYAEASLNTQGGRMEKSDTVPVQVIEQRILVI